MRLRSLISFLSLIALTAGLQAAVTDSETFTVATVTRVPGASLQPGKYSIQLLNQLWDRDILRVDTANGQVVATFIGIRNVKADRGSNAHILNWSNPADGTSYLRGWRPSKANGVSEFVYPKSEAVAIAKVNDARVPAIDPASEGRVADPTLSNEDMKLVTLWLLSASPVGANASAPDVKAVRYQQDPARASASQAPRQPALRQLPHTAGMTSWLWIAGLLCLIAAVGFRVATGIGDRSTFQGKF